MEQDVANGKEVLQMSHLILELSDRISSDYVLMPSCDSLLPSEDPEDLVPDPQLGGSQVYVMEGLSR